MERLTPEKYNGFLFQREKRVSSTFQTPYDMSIQGIATNNSNRNGNFPAYSGKIYTNGIKVINVVLNDLDTDRDALVIAMDVRRDQQIKLYALDRFGKRWWVYATCTGLNTEDIDENTGNFGYIFEVNDPTWTQEKVITDTWNITASGQTHTIHIEGNQPTMPIYTATPTTNLATYFPNKQYIKNYNPIGVAQTDGIDITNGGWDHAAAVAAGKALANGDDVLVYVDGISVPRWFGGGGLGSSTLQIFVRVAWLPGRTLVLRTAIAGAGTPAQLQFVVNAASKTSLNAMPASGIIRIQNEEFSYTTKNAAACTVNVVERTIRGTSIASHAANITCYWVEHDIKLIYGNSVATTPVFSDRYKPVYNLTTSTNIFRDYQEFADTNNLRAGAWIRKVIDDGQGKLNRVYSGNEASLTEVDPATDMGSEIDAYEGQGRTRPETAKLAWGLYHPAGITLVTSSGEKFKLAATTTWPKLAALESSVDGKKYVTEWNETTPTVPNVWQTWSHANEAIPAGRPYVWFAFAGSIDAATANNTVRFEVDACQITLNSSNIIQVGMNGEIAGLHFSSILANTTTGQSILIEYPVSQNQPFTIDTENMAVTYRGMNAIRGISLDGTRTEWLWLVPGDNILQYIANTWTGNITIVTTYHHKAL